MTFCHVSDEINEIEFGKGNPLTVPSKDGGYDYFWRGFWYVGRKGTGYNPYLSVNEGLLYFDVSFNANGGSVPATTINVWYGDIYYQNFPVPTRTGYTFAGWYTAASGGTPVSLGTTVNKTTLGNLTLYAHWTLNSYTNKVDPNGGYRASDNSTEVITYNKNYGETETISERRRTGYTLTGYKVTNSNNGSTTDLGGAVFTFDSSTKTGSLKQGTVPITLTAQWKVNTYTVRFNGNGATSGSTATQNFTYNAPQNLTSNGFQQKYTVSYEPGEGLNSSSATATSTFNGWNTAANGSGTAYSNQQSVKNLTATNGGNITLYAQWTKGSVTLPSPTKTGKVCTGWYTADGKKVGDCGASYTPTGNITLHAEWETVGYTVTWKNYDGTVLETDEAVAQGTTPTYNGAIPTKPDSEEKSYAFSHWSPAISPVTGDIEYIAQFTEGARQYALTFAFDDGKGQLTGNEKAPVGSVVTVNPLPNNGYAVKDIIAYKTGDKSTSVSIDSNNYSFTMPPYDVTIEVTWVESDVIYTSAYKDVEPTFTVTIPASVTLGNEITVRAENVRVNKGYQVVVSAADVSGEGEPFTMTSGEGHTFAYSITVDGAAISSGENVLVVNPDTASAGNAVLKFERPQKAIYAGNYSGNVVFTIAVQPVGNDGN
ncbi:MAG: InlB B-repeat-containing protein [Oscillospiraceae bacterium]